MSTCIVDTAFTNNLPCLMHAVLVLTCHSRLSHETLDLSRYLTLWHRSEGGIPCLWPLPSC